MIHSSRVNGFDALRAIAMWLGVVLHALIAYKLLPEPGWPHDPGPMAGFYSWCYDFIHIFRMPLFFLVAGYFARLVLIKKGVTSFVKNRAQRILVPFLLGLIILVPVTLLPFHVANSYPDKLNWVAAWEESLTHLTSWNGMAHLWFLYYLLFFYVVATGIHLATFRRKQIIPLQKFSLILVSTIVVVFLITYYGNAPIPPVYTGLKVPVFNFVYYLFFFLLGYFINTDHLHLKAIRENGVLLTLIGLALSAVPVLVPAISNLFLSLFISASETICLVFGITGLFLKYFNVETKFWRYASDASYWMYLVHMGIVAFLQVWLINSFVPAMFKLPLVILVTFFISIVSYKYLVRNTVIGRILNGAGSRPAKKVETAP